MTRRTRRFTARALREECQALKADLLAQGLASVDECAAYWPGGAENADRGFDGFIVCFQQYGRLLGRLELRATSGVDDGQLERAVRAAAARQPMPVLLSIGDRNVYPKSAWALSFLESLDDIVAPMAALVAEISEHESSANDELRGMPRLVEGLAWRTWSWILLTEGVGLPFGDEGDITPPEWTSTLLFEDIITIWVAHRQLHADAAAIMTSAMPRERGERSRLTLSGFLAGYASEHGIAPSHIMRRWSLPEAIAAAMASAESHRVAEANAQRKSRASGA